MSEPNDNIMSKDIPNEKKFSFSRQRSMLCHVMEQVGQSWKEVYNKKVKIYSQDFTWNKRIWVINHDAIIIDRKGNAHYYIDVNNTDGVLRFSKPFIEKCIDCSKSIGIDAQNARDLLKRKTISAIWGVDNSHIMLLMILAIALLVMGIAIMYMYGETQRLNAQVIKQSASLILGVNYFVE